MKARILPLATALGVALIALALLATVSLAAPIEDDVASVGQGSAPGLVSRSDGDRTGVLHARAISIPFGIASPLLLIDGGSRIVVTGPVDCAGGETFELRVTVRQKDGSTAVAHGTTQGVCTQDTWEAIATVRGRSTFVEGDVEVCGIVRVENIDGRAASRRWCPEGLQLAD